MSLKAGRVGVNPKEVDVNGNLKESSNSYSKAESDEKFETKADIGGLQFRVESGKAQYKIPEGDWVNFNSGSGGVGFNIPVDGSIPITSAMIQSGSAYFDLVEGSRYFIDDNKMLYLDMSITTKSQFSGKSGYLYLPVDSQPDYSSIVDNAIASVRISNNASDSGGLNNCRIDMHNPTNVEVDFDGVAANGTFRLYGQIQLQI